MKLSTDIRPRKDGTVATEVPGPNGGRYVFSLGKSGALECDVDVDAHITWLLDTGYFYPTDEADIDAGIASVAGDDEAQPLVKRRGRRPKA